MSERPKSAYEIAMARLAAGDREAGEAAVVLTEAQKERIAERRRVFAARIAEREILLKDTLRKTGDPTARERLEEEFASERRRYEADRDREIETIRGETGSENAGHR